MHFHNYTVTCLEYSIITTSENIYICTVRKSRYNNDKAIVRTLYRRHVYHVKNLVEKENTF